MKSSVINKIHVYSQTTDKSEIIATLEVGDIIYIDHETDFGKFYKVSFGENKTGYVLKDAKFYDTIKYKVSKKVDLYSKPEKNANEYVADKNEKIEIWGYLENEHGQWFRILAEPDIDGYLPVSCIDKLIPPEVVERNRKTALVIYILGLIITIISGFFQLLAILKYGFVDFGILSFIAFFAVTIQYYKKSRKDKD